MRLPATESATMRGFRRSAAFWGAAYAYLVAALGTTLPTPIYELYERRLDFTTEVLTVVFATYAVGVIAAIVLFGPLSDRVGRRPVFGAALAVAAASAALFLVAETVGLLLVARFVSGLSIGLIAAAAAATLTDLEPGGDTRRASRVSTAASIFGLGLGPVVAGALVEYAPFPTRLPFAVFICLLVPAFAAIWAMPETVVDRAAGPRLRMRPPTVPRQARSAFALAAPAAFVAFAVLGLLTSLAPTFAERDLAVTNDAVVGVVVFAAFGASGLAQLLLRGLGNRAAMTAGLVAAPVGLLLIVLSLESSSLALFVAGAVAGGAGSGLAFMGSLALVNERAPAGRRAETISAYFVVGYVAIGLPVVGDGFAAQLVGLNRAAVAYAITIATLALATGVLTWWQGRGPRLGAA